MKIEERGKLLNSEEKSDTMADNQKICLRCILDSSIPDIRFDDRGICNFCKIHDELEKPFPLNEMGQQKLNLSSYQLACRLNLVLEIFYEQYLDGDD